MMSWCRAQKIEVTRSRAYKKNDQAFVDQRNGAVVRLLVGYGRFDGVETARVMARLYAAVWLHVHFFHPSFKLKEKRREESTTRPASAWGSHLVATWDVRRFTPACRLGQL